MRDEQQRARILAEPVLEPQHGVEVEVVGGLVEQQQIGAALQRLREVEPHAPAAGKARHRIAVARLGEPEAGQQHRGACARAVAADRLEAVMQIGQAPRRRARVRLGGGEARLRSRAARGRRRARSRARSCPTGAVSCATCAMVHDPGQIDAAGIRKELVADGREQARLAAAVGADEAELVARVHGQVRAFEEPTGAARQREVRDAKHLFQLELVVDHERRVIGEAAVLVDRTPRAPWPRCRAWRSGSRCATRRSSSTPVRDWTTTCTARDADPPCGTRRRSPGRRTRA